MRTIIAGSRGVNNMETLELAMSKCGWTPTVVLCGMAKGADRMGRLWAQKRGIPVEEYPARWLEHGKAAGMIRNRLMAEKGEALVALWDGESRGTKNMIDLAYRKGLHVYEHLVVTIH